MNKVAYVLVLIGALNWGLVGISSKFDLVALIGGGMEGVVARIIYVLVGLSAVWLIVSKLKGKKAAPMTQSNPSMDSQM